MLGRRVNSHVMTAYDADKALAAGYEDKLVEVHQAERDLRDAQAAGRSGVEVRGLSKAFDAALLDALRAAEAGQRVAMGTGTYPTSDDAKAVRTAQISSRKATAKAAVRPWIDEVNRLRTARETLKLSFRAVARV